MASAAVAYPIVSTRNGQCSNDHKEFIAPDYALFRDVLNSSSKRVTFLLKLPWGSTAVASIPLLELPVLTDSEIHELPCVDGGRIGLDRLPSSSEFHRSAVGLYLPGFFLLSFAATRAGLEGDAAAADAAVSKLRLILQSREVHASSFIPLEEIVGSSEAASVAVARGVKRLEVESATTEENVRGAPLCSLWLLFRLPGGKGGFGALLKKQRRKKRANFSIDACRDLTGRRIRQAQVVTRIKAWMEKKRKEEALVRMLAQDAPEKLPEAKPEVSLDAAFMSQQLASVSEMPDIVARGLKQQLALREKEKAEQRARAAAPQNRVLYAQLRDAVELDSDDEQWSDMEAEEDSNDDEQECSSSSNASGMSSATSKSRLVSNRAPVSCDNTAAGGPSASSANNGYTSSSSASNGSTSSSSKKSAPPQLKKVDGAAQAMLQQLEQMRLKAASVEAAERERREAAAAELAKAKAEAERAAAEAAERVAREAQQLDVSRFSTAEELSKAVDEAVVKEKLRQLGWKCGGRPEERAARLMQLKTVDLANVPKALLARQPARRG